MSGPVVVAVAVACGRCRGSGNDPHLGGGSISIGRDGETTHRSYQSPCGPCGGSGKCRHTAVLTGRDALVMAWARAQWAYDEAVKAEVKRQKPYRDLYSQPKPMNKSGLFAAVRETAAALSSFDAAGEGEKDG